MSLTRANPNTKPFFLLFFLILFTTACNPILPPLSPTFQCQDSSGNRTLNLYLFPQPPQDMGTISQDMWERYISYIANISCDIDVFWNSEFGSLYQSLEFVTHEDFGSISSRTAPHPSLVCVLNPPGLSVRGYYCTQTQTGNQSVVVNVDEQWMSFRVWEGRQRIGYTSIAMMLAHEWGHHIAWRILDSGGALDTQRQRDHELISECYTGAFWKSAITNSSNYSVTYRQQDWESWLDTIRSEIRARGANAPVSQTSLGTWASITLREQIQALELGFNSGIGECNKIGLQQEVIVNSNTQAYYNQELDTALDKSSPLFPAPNISEGDPRIFPAGEPDLSPVSSILGDWLTNPSTLNSNWIPTQPIPNRWSVNHEVAIVYEIDSGTQGFPVVQGSFGVDNGIFIWVNGQFRFGALAPGSAPADEYIVDLGNMQSGINYIQILLEDHGGSTGYRVQISGFR